MTAPALEITGLTVRYGDVTAVHDLDLELAAGETVALLGPNGAGKSSTVNAVLGLVPPSAGQVRVLGRRPREAVEAGCVGVMLQHGGLPSQARVGEVVRLVRRSFPSPWPAEDLLVVTDVAGLVDRRVDQLSGGQRQRVMLALALAGTPPLLVLDEPTAAMDVESRRSFWTTMRELAARGHTVVFATHHLEEADAVADRVVVVAGGRVVADGSAAQVKASASGRTIRFTADPATRFGGLPAVTDEQWHGTSVTLRTADPETTLRALLARHDRLPDLEVRGASLEDAFVSLTAAAVTTATPTATAGDPR
ncbi:ATP-binding cassette domain-containing protein [Modestobacter sp. I12A-02628]|uniref:ATP-binding cassette domain-containing protein n=1 Tax=Goekera deserti TaxID=2497753 RepID=A0A7K3WBF9_9ACTN|nr:ATP-binding cassette domain-containing protein [Goekera deserti]MPQ97489.1 ATP-binding cassette domain-containing protein [Goekera deserti]NDI47908.1 ATP-binding cassette domain-containing protein [Goekera deserti]NEL53656.1 ATP-binding cassette domain-containing protein [Goekera deserti]